MFMFSSLNYFLAKVQVVEGVGGLLSGRKIAHWGSDIIIVMSLC